MDPTKSQRAVTDTLPLAHSAVHAGTVSPVQVASRAARARVTCRASAPVCPVRTSSLFVCGSSSKATDLSEGSSHQRSEKRPESARSCHVSLSTTSCLNRDTQRLGGAWSQPSAYTCAGLNGGAARRCRCGSPSLPARLRRLLSLTDTLAGGVVISFAGYHHISELF
ncbi:hypothetical protein AAFF_G00240290 [Aldrovandia affinis]|uniref:Uncharacterized protein n=1 Tax=Aldrovandia affinis TaxID=143900 RepID=A0AAD7SVJ4_9TELE|nr:hypothetical protein AAFF_G00240290 [Aldrovandia affinis]